MLIDVIGWIGAILIVVAYLLVSIGKVSAERSPYHWINLVASVAILINSYVYGAMPSVMVNVVWAGIAVYALVGIWRTRKV